MANHKTKLPQDTVPESQPRSVASIALAVISIGLCVLLEGAILASRQRFSRFVDEFEIDVAVVTRFAIGPIFPALLAAVIFSAIFKEFVPGLRPALDLCNLAILLIGAICFAIYVVGVFAPLMSLIEPLS